MRPRALAWLVVSLAMHAGAPAVAQTPAERPGYLGRAVSKTDRDVRVSVAVLSDEEGEAVYGARLAAMSIQPVWVEVAKAGVQTYGLLSPGIEPHTMTKAPLELMGAATSNWSPRV
mgnify:CR=1 FL=1